MNRCCLLFPALLLAGWGALPVTATELPGTNPCPAFSESGAEVGEAGGCDDGSVCQHLSSLGGPDGTDAGGNCGSCNAPRVSNRDNIAYINDTPLFLRIPNAPDLFMKWRYTTDSTNMSIMGPRITTVHTDIGIAEVSANSRITLARGNKTMVLRWKGTEYVDDAYICKAIVDSSGRVCVTYPSQRAVQVFGTVAGTSNMYPLCIYLQDGGGTNWFNYTNINGRAFLSCIKEDSGAGRQLDFLYNTAANLLLTNVQLRVGGGPAIRQASFAYDASNRLSRITDMGGYSTWLVWTNGPNKVVLVTNSTEVITIRAGDIARRVNLGDSTRLHWRRWLDDGQAVVFYGTPGMATNSLIYTTMIGYRSFDGIRLPIWETNGAGTVTLWAYTNKMKSCEWVTSGFKVGYNTYNAWAANTRTNFSTRWKYDANRRVVESIRRRSATCQITNRYAYYTTNDFGSDQAMIDRYGEEVQAETNALGVATRYFYEHDLSSNLFIETTTVDPAGLALATVTIRDAKDRVVSESDALGCATRYEYYDVEITNGTDTLQWSARNGKLRSVQKYDAEGSPAGPPTVYNYGMDSQYYTLWDETTPPYQGTTRREYDVLERLARTTFPDGSVENRTYGCCQNVQQISRGDAASSNIVATYSYDGLRRLVDEAFYFDHPDPAIDHLGRQYSYDPLGNVIETIEYKRLKGSITNITVASSSKVYDASGKLVSQNDRGGPAVSFGDFKYGFGSMPSPAATTYGDPSGVHRTERRSYYNDGTVFATCTESSDGSRRAVTNVYDAEGNLVRAYRPSGHYTEYFYDAAGRLTSEFSRAAAGNLLGSRSFAYDANGNTVRETDELGTATLSEYDALGRVIARGVDVDGDGSLTSDPATLTTYTTDANGYLIVTTTIPGSFTHTVEYDSMGRVDREFTTESFATEYDYDYLGRIVKTTRGGTVVACDTYDSVNLLGSVDALGRTNRFEYDALNRPKKTIYPDGLAVEVAYQTGKDVIAVDTITTNTLPADQYLYSYDALLQRTAVVHDLDRNGSRNGDDRATFSDYDGFGQVTNVHGNDTWPVRYSYDIEGQLTGIIDGNTNLTAFAYDAAGRLTRRTFADGAHYDYAYTTNGLLSSMVVYAPDDTECARREYAYDLLGRVTNVLAATTNRQSEVSFAYNELGQRTEMNDGVGTTTWDYYGSSEPDGAGMPLLKSETRIVPGAATSVVGYAYTAQGMRKSMDVAACAAQVYSLAYSYDIADRMTGIVETRGAGTVSYPYTYKPNWDLIETVGASNGVAVSQRYTYDGLGRRLAVISSIQNPGSSIQTLSSRTYGYNSAGQRISQTIDYPASSSQNPGSRQQTLLYGYDQYGQLTNAISTKAGIPQNDYRYSYQYDAIGNRQTEQRNAFSMVFAHNNLNQMTSREWSGGLMVSGYAGSKNNPNLLGSAAAVSNVAVNNVAAQLDTNGSYVVESVEVKEGTNNVITAVNINAAIPPAGDTNTLNAKSIKWDKLAIEPNKITLTYDALGNLTNDGVRTYEWDANGMLKSVTSDKLQVKSEYEYDGLSRKVRSRDFLLITNLWTLATDVCYMYDGWNCVAEIDAKSSSHQVTKSYIWGLDLSGTLQGAGGVGGLLSSTCYLLPATCNFFVYDGNGNVVNLVSADTGAITAHYEYDPFGRLTCKEGSYAETNQYRFSTKRYSTAWSLYDYGFRHYSPDLGRWLSRDPIGESGGINVFAATRNNTISIVDAHGLWPEDDPEFIAKSLIVTIKMIQMANGMRQAIQDFRHLEDRCDPTKDDVQYRAQAVIMSLSSDPDEANEKLRSLNMLSWGTAIANVTATALMEGTKKAAAVVAAEAIDDAVRGGIPVVLLKVILKGDVNTCWGLWTRIQTRMCARTDLVFWWRYDWTQWSKPHKWRPSTRGLFNDNTYVQRDVAEEDAPKCAKDQFDEYMK